MNKNEMMIMVVPTKELFGSDYFEGFKNHKDIDFESRILSKYKYMRRGLAEVDPTHKQPIAYSIIVNPTTKKVFAYQRSKDDKKYGESRLQGKWSWGVGGHIEHLDTKNNNPINDSMLRELDEEVHIKGSSNPKVLGYINYDSNEVSKVHFGILYVIETDATEVEPKQTEIDNGDFRTVEELKNICNSKDNEVEEWSNIALTALELFLNK